MKGKSPSQVRPGQVGYGENECGPAGYHVHGMCLDKCSLHKEQVKMGS